MARLVDLPSELMLQIFSHLRVNGRIPWRYSKVCKRLLMLFDEENLRTFCYRSPVYNQFETIFSPVFSHRRHILKELNYIIVLPEYDSLVEEAASGDPGNDTTFFNALKRLFMMLNKWWQVNGTDIPHDDQSSGFTLVLHVVSKPLFSKRFDGHIKTFPRVAPVKLPLEAESQLPTIDCVRSLEVRSMLGSATKDMNYNERSRKIDSLSLQRLASRMLGLRPNACSSWRLSNNEPISHTSFDLVGSSHDLLDAYRCSPPLQMNWSGYGSNHEPVSSTSDGLPVSNRGLQLDTHRFSTPLQMDWSGYGSNNELDSYTSSWYGLTASNRGLRDTRLRDNVERISTPLSRHQSLYENNNEPVSRTPTYRRRPAPNRDLRLSGGYNVEPISPSSQINRSGQENNDHLVSRTSRRPISRTPYGRRPASNHGLLDTHQSENVERIPIPLTINQSGDENYNNEPVSHRHQTVPDCSLLDTRLSDNVEPTSTTLQANQSGHGNNNEPGSHISYGLLDALLADDELDPEILNDLLQAGLPDDEMDAYCRLFGGS